MIFDASFRLGHLRSGPPGPPHATAVVIERIIAKNGHLSRVSG